MQFTVDPGIAAQSMLLAVVERGLGGCMVGSIDREGLRADFHIPDRFAIALVIALGVPDETIVLGDDRESRPDRLLARRRRRPPRAETPAR